jgi:cysteine synthase B
MPSNVSSARKGLTRAFGAELVFSDPMEQSDGAIRLVKKLVAEDPSRWYYPDQYANPNNPLAHERGTAEEIWAQTGGRVTHFVAGIGTTGTIMGATRGLKRKNAAIRCVALEPAEALHGLEGLKHMASSIVPPIWDPSILDEVMPMSTDAGWDMADRLAREEGLLAGHSAGAAVAGALVVARRLKERGEGGVVVTVLPDRADRYFEKAPGT